MGQQGGGSQQQVGQSTVVDDTAKRGAWRVLEWGSRVAATNSRLDSSQPLNAVQSGAQSISAHRVAAATARRLWLVHSR